jgi:hypothetical protein
MLCHVRGRVHGHDGAWPSRDQLSAPNLDSRFRGNDWVAGRVVTGACPTAFNTPYDGLQTRSESASTGFGHRVSSIGRTQGSPLRRYNATDSTTGRAEGLRPSALLTMPPLPKGDTGGLAWGMKWRSAQPILRLWGIEIDAVKSNPLPFNR